MADRDQVPSGARQAVPFLSLAAPCFNEAAGIQAVVRSWIQVLEPVDFSWEIVIANDGSSDESPALLDALSAEDSRVQVVHLSQNRGYGAALRAAISATRGQYVMTLDSDGQFPVEDGLRLLQHARDQGLRFVGGRRHQKQDALARVAADRTFNRLVRSLFGVHLRDTNCALKVVEGELLRGLQLEGRGFVLPTEIVLRVRAAGIQVQELEISHRERQAGTTKLRAVEAGWEMARFLWYLRMQLALQKQRVVDPRVPS